MSEQREILAPNIHPNPEYYIEREDEIKRVENFIERTEGAIIGLTGVRGSGKTSVMEKSINKYKRAYFTLKITSPTGYDEKEFFIMVFQRLCEEVNKRIEEIFRIRTNLEKRAKRERTKYLALYLILIFIPVVLVWLILLPDIPIYFSSFLPKALFVSYITVIPSGILLLFVVKQLRKVRKYPKMVGLYLVTQDILETLKYEKTISYQAEAKVGIIRQIATIFKIGKELKTRPFTLPGLTAEYNDYVSNVIEVFGGKVIICIDELDKITDPEDVKKLLRGIKGAIFQKNCYYLISISEDAVRTFKTRISTESDMLESTFDEIINLDRINLDIARKIAKKRLGYNDDKELSQNVKKSIDIVSIFSGGIPRELIRNLREVSMKFGKDDIIPTEAWKILFEKKIGDFKNEVMLASISEDIKYDIAEQLAPYDFFNGEIQLRETLDGLYKRLESERLESSKSDEKKEMAQEIDKLQKGTLELKIDAIIFEYLKKNMSNGEEFLHNLLKAFFMLPYCKKLSEKHISDAITLLNAKLLSQEKSK